MVTFIKINWFDAILVRVYSIICNIIGIVPYCGISLVLYYAENQKFIVSPEFSYKTSFFENLLHSF